MNNLTRVSSMTTERFRGTNHADRVIRVQQAFSDLPGTTHTLKSIADHTKLDPAVVHRIIQSAAKGGAIERVGHGRYRLGSHTAEAGIRAMAGCYEPLDQHQILTDLQATCGGLVLFYTLAPVGARRVCSDYAIGDYNTDDFGMTAYELLTAGASLRTGASGRVLLAYAPEDLQEIALAEPIPETAGPGVLDDEALLASIAEIRRQGYAIGRQECLAGWDSIAAPALWGSTVLGVVCLMKPVGQMPEDLTEYIRHVRESAAFISQAAGHGGRNPRIV
jgi:DNA-binding IclR family transcriptional regulator